MPQGWEPKLRSPRPAAGNEDRANSSFPTAEAVREATEPALARAGAGWLATPLPTPRAPGRRPERRVGEAARPGPARLPRHAVRARRPPSSARVPARRAPAAQLDHPGGLAPLPEAVYQLPAWLASRQTTRLDILVPVPPMMHEDE